MPKKYGFLLLLMVVATLSVTYPMLKLGWEELLSRRRNKALHEKIFASVIVPTAKWVEASYSSNLCLPDQNEVERYAASISFVPLTILIYTNSIPAGQEQLSVPNFELCVPIGDWNLFYRSCDRKQYKYWTD